MFALSCVASVGFDELPIHSRDHMFGGPPDDNHHKRHFQELRISFAKPWLEERDADDAAYEATAENEESVDEACGEDGEEQFDRVL